MTDEHRSGQAGVDPIGSDLAQYVADRLVEHGLEGPSFDRVAIEADLRVRLDLDAGLDALIGPGDPAATLAETRPFDPRNP